MKNLFQRSIFFTKKQLEYLKKHNEENGESKGALLRRLLNKHIKQEKMEEKNG